MILPAQRIEKRESLLVLRESLQKIFGNLCITLPRIGGVSSAILLRRFHFLDSPRHHLSFAGKAFDVANIDL